MLIDAELTEIQCIIETQSGGASPYLWTDLLWIYEQQPGSPGDAVGVANADNPPPATDSDLILAEGVQSGATVPIPPEIGALATRIPAGLAQAHVVVVAVLWKVEGTPGRAVEAGYEAFLQSIYQQISDNLLELSSDPSAAAGAIETAVYSAVRKAIEDALGVLDELLIELGIDQTDVVIGSDYAVYTPPSAEGTTTSPLTLVFDGAKGESYQVTGQWIVTSDPCEQQYVNWWAAQLDLANAEGGLRQLAGIDHLTPEQEQELNELIKYVTNQRAVVAGAWATYENCEERHPVPPRPLRGALA